ncbi:hypothetical protein GCM10028805_45640 [Spirosoma harenae]
MIPLFPYWKFVIRSPLSHEEALARLSGEVAPVQGRPLFSRETRPHEFTGTLSKTDFYIERIIQYRNSFLPTIHGRFLLTEAGLQVHIVMMLNVLALFIGIGLSLCALPILAAIVYRLIVTGHFEETLRTPTLVLACLYVLFTGGFCYEAITARHLLNRIFAVSENNP